MLYLLRAAEQPVLEHFRPDRYNCEWVLLLYRELVELFEQHRHFHRSDWLEYGWTWINYFFPQELTHLIRDVLDHRLRYLPHHLLPHQNNCLIPGTKGFPRKGAANEKGHLSAHPQREDPRRQWLVFVFLGNVYCVQHFLVYDFHTAAYGDSDSHLPPAALPGAVWRQSAVADHRSDDLPELPDKAVALETQFRQQLHSLPAGLPDSRVYLDFPLCGFRTIACNCKIHFRVFLRHHNRDVVRPFKCGDSVDDRPARSQRPDLQVVHRNGLRVPRVQQPDRLDVCEVPRYDLVNENPPRNERKSSRGLT